MVTVNVNAALVGRLAATDYQAYYDTTLNITWLADASYAKTSGYTSAGLTWENASTWVENLNFSGYDGWRLPTMIDVGNDACGNEAYSGTDCGYNVLTTDGDTVYSEMASLFYDTLGNIGLYDTDGIYPQPGSGLINTGPFSNMINGSYWTNLGSVTQSSGAWYFNFDGGQQDVGYIYSSINAWAVHDGDIGASVVPVPATVWLFVSGLIGLAGLAKRK